jgi:hypothetical protein
MSCVGFRHPKHYMFRNVNNAANTSQYPYPAPKSRRSRHLRAKSIRSPILQQSVEVEDEHLQDFAIENDWVSDDENMVRYLGVLYF